MVQRTYIVISSNPTVITDLFCWFMPFILLGCFSLFYVIVNWISAAGIHFNLFNAGPSTSFPMSSRMSWMTARYDWFGDRRAVCHVSRPSHDNNLWLYNRLIRHSDHLNRQRYCAVSPAITHKQIQVPVQQVVVANALTKTWPNVSWLILKHCSWGIEPGSLWWVLFHCTRRSGVRN